MKDLRKCINNSFENIAKHLAENNACAFFWGEIEMPEALREEIEGKNEVKIICHD